MLGREVAAEECAVNHVGGVVVKAEEIKIVVIGDEAHRIL